jgi:hypothetical protein
MARLNRLREKAIWERDYSLSGPSRFDSFAFKARLTPALQDGDSFSEAYKGVPFKTAGRIANTTKIKMV